MAQAITPPWPSECEQCTCDLDGIARCLVADCAPPPCVNTVYETGHCCPTCQDGPNCYVDRSRTRVIPAGEAVWVEPCTQCRCHDGQDVGYWEGNRVAKCERLRNCHPLDRQNS
ncbi:von Willebrand factor C domain-containing protein 2-like [Chelonoidis abingdonii]|uniref:von Willebrand factor C domain-containing protein 2-like n=1 Tax=Chelonoidis abingdonii TaxID=106734 RepID=UPI003F49B408